MISFLKKQHLIFIFFILIYLIFGLINLETLPVAWTDEIMHIDPAIQFIKNGEFTSKVWPNPGSEIVFASYPPLIHWWHTFWIRLTHPSIFLVRLPFLIFHIISLILIFKYLLNNQINPILTSLIVISFALDKTVFEISRSVRIEVILILLITLYIHIQKIQNLFFIRALLLGLMSIAHLYVWPVIFVWSISELMKLSLKKQVVFSMILLLPVALYLHSIHYNYVSLITQIGKQTTDHQINSGSASNNVLLNSFYYRFFPQYKEQPLVLIGVLFLFGIVLKNFFQYKKWPNINTNELAFFILFITLFFALSPQYRYLPVLYCLGILIVPLNVNFKLKWFLVLIVINGSISFVARHSVALVQRDARLSKPILNFINLHVQTNKKTLIIGESIGAYYSFLRRDTMCDYGIDFYPQHWNWNNYSQVILLTKKHHEQGTFIAEYKPETQFQLPTFVTALGKGGSYENTKIYRLK